MTTGASAGAWVLLAVMASAAAWGAAPNAGFTLEELMGDLARVRSAVGKFTERKYLSILEAPLDSSGTLVYRAPGRLEKHTLVPERESLVLNDGQLVLENTGRGWRKSFTLREHPAIWAFVESIRSTLAGDLPTLQRFYNVALSGDAADWELRLRPREAAIKDVVDEIRIRGAGTWISGIEILETAGDRSVMTISRDPS